MLKIEKMFTFKKEIGLIKSDYIKRIVTMTLKEVPDWFFEVGASASGKYHPKFSQGKGGLVRHTKMAVQIADDLFRMNKYNFDEYDRDIIIAALILHDIGKYGLDNTPAENMVHTHPLLAGDIISLATTELHDAYGQDIEYLKIVISTHMGQWSTSKYTNEILPEPFTKIQEFVHLCDYLSSRKFFDLFE